MTSHAVACLPNEACGLVAFDPAGAVRRVYPLANARPSPRGFTLDPREHLEATDHAESHGWEIGAVFHSHPVGPAHPSALDLDRANPVGWLQFIVGFEPDLHIRAWRQQEGIPVEIRLGE